MAKHARTTITVPSDLKARMEAVDEPVNWSAIACAAFEQKLAEIIKQRGTKDMDEVIDRLRASKKKHDSEQYQQGHEAGQEWAKEQAEVDELLLLEKWEQSCPPTEWQDCFIAGDRSAYSVAENFVFRIWPDDDGDRGAAQNFWEQQGREDNPDGEFVRGFAEGALGIWNQVKDKL
jgi:hypothetical protein